MTDIESRGKLFAKLKVYIEQYLYKTGLLEKYIFSRCKQAALVLTYHRVNKAEYIDRCKVMPGMFVSDVSFEMQIKWIKQHFKVVSLKEVIEYVKGGKKYNEAICAITFDDGWGDVYRYGYPILKKYDVPATIFVIGKALEDRYIDCFNLNYEVISNIEKLAGDISNLPEIANDYLDNKLSGKDKAVYINRKLRKIDINEFDHIYDKLKYYYIDKLVQDGLYDKYAQLSCDEIREMQKNHINFGYHSKSHYMLTKIRNDMLSDELEIPMDTAKRNNIRFERLFCYPDSNFNDKIIDHLKKLNYVGAASLIAGLNRVGTDPYKLKRINVHEGSSSTISSFLSMIARSI